MGGGTTKRRHNLRTGLEHLGHGDRQVGGQTERACFSYRLDVTFPLLSYGMERENQSEKRERMTLGREAIT